MPPGGHFEKPLEPAPFNGCPPPPHFTYKHNVPGGGIGDVEALGQISDPDVKQQAHYTKFKIQPVTFIEANDLPYCVGNVIKYVCRYESKDGLKDLLKARNYIDYLIQKMRTGQVIP